jgi:hypothetical protein
MIRIAVFDKLNIIHYFERSFPTGDAPGEGRIKGYPESQHFTPYKCLIGYASVRLGIYRKTTEDKKYNKDTVHRNVLISVLQKTHQSNN